MKGAQIIPVFRIRVEVAGAAERAADLQQSVGQRPPMAGVGAWLSIGKIEPDVSLRLFAHLARLAASRTFCTAGSSNPIRIAIIAITTSSSMSVKPRLNERWPIQGISRGEGRDAMSFMAIQQWVLGWSPPGGAG